MFEEHIRRNAKIFTDKWRGYSPLKDIYIVIHQIKPWITTVPPML